jgi:uncharacterized integral membrane protein
MPWRLIGFIVLFAIFLTFIGFNLENRCDISFGFREFPQVPVYLTTFASFVFGMLITIPFAITFRIKKRQKAAKSKDSTQNKTDSSNMIDAPQAAPKKLSKKEKEALAEINPSDYGIN